MSIRVGPRRPWGGLLGPACGIATLWVCVAAYADPPGPLAAHPEPPAPVAAPGNSGPQDPKAARAHELEALRAEQKRAADNEAKLRQDIATINENRRKLNEDLINTAARVRSLEERVSATEVRLQALGEQESAVKNSLQGRRGEIAKVLATLQRMGRRPPPAILVSPDDALESVRAAILVGAVLPQMEGEARSLAHDLGELVRVHHAMAQERDGMTTISPHSPTTVSAWASSLTSARKNSPRPRRRSTASASMPSRSPARQTRSKIWWPSSTKTGPRARLIRAARRPAGRAILRD